MSFDSIEFLREENAKRKLAAMNAREWDSQKKIRDSQPTRGTGGKMKGLGRGMYKNLQQRPQY
jgi:hypothetical protein